MTSVLNKKMSRFQDEKPSDNPMQQVIDNSKAALAEPKDDLAIIEEVMHQSVAVREPK